MGVGRNCHGARRRFEMAGM
ncbi:hypothetical protein A2U01_0110625, partial [Trifolium medium]|nr:hypothetical protein [Trifolium medium]